MNRVLIAFLAIVAVVSAESWHEIWVNCYDKVNHNSSRFGESSDEFLQVVTEANRHLNTRIYVCCSLGLYSEEYAEGGPQTLFDFKFNVEIIGTIPDGGCTKSNQYKASPRDLKRPVECSTPQCQKAVSQTIRMEAREFDYFDGCLATIWSYGNIWLFEGKAKILFIQFLAGSLSGQTTNKRIAEFKEMDRVALLKNISQSPLIDLPLGPNAIIASTYSGDASFEFSAFASVFITDNDANEQNIKNDCAFNSWFIISLAQQLELEAVLVEAFDFHIMLRYSGEVEVSDSLLFFDSNLIIDLVLCYISDGEDCPVAQTQFQLPSKDLKKAKRQPEILAQVELSLEDTGVVFTNLDNIFPIGPVDLGLISIIFPEYIPEILYLELKDVFWFNIVRIIGAGSDAALCELGYDYQGTKITDEVFLTLGEDS